MKFYCYICNNVDQELVSMHKEASDLVGIDVEYCIFDIEQLSEAGMSPHLGHGWFMEQVLAQDQNELIGFIDIDCIVASKDFVQRCADAVYKSKTILGAAQCASHLPSRDMPYAAPAFLIAHKGAWERVGSPSLIANSEYDTGQALSVALLNDSYSIDLLWPDGHANVAQAWPLGAAGEYGIGTRYADGQVFHLFQSSKGPSYVHLLKDQLQKLNQGFTSFHQ